jgi:pyruvate,water dikinase
MGDKMRRFVKMFGEMTKRDSQEAGGKAANLGELQQNGFNVPSGFCVTSGSLSYVIDQMTFNLKLTPLSIP